MGIQGKISKNKRKKINKRLKNRFFVKKCFNMNSTSMEDLIVNAKEHNILKKYCKRLQERFNVQIRMPSTTSLDSDVIFVSMEGEDSDREYVKKFLAEKIKESVLNPAPDEECVNFHKDNVDIVTLSDSESESEDICIVNIEGRVKSESHDESVCIGNSSTSSLSLHKTADNDEPKGNKRKRYAKENSQKVSSSEVSSSEDSDTTDDDMVAKKAKLSESVVIIEETSGKPAEDFIPLFSGKKYERQKNEINDESVIIIDEPQSTIAPRLPRPVVIDGSNVAMEHGKPSRTFSVKGIKLAIDYFLNRGHTQVTAFIPKYRKNRNPNRTVCTTDVDILDELERTQQVVFTPSRRVNGRNINSYDDRFIVQLAASNKGVIVSNDNYRDLLNENESYKEAIENRLLMFCFVGDVFMVPEDPMGREGPKLADFLSFPPEDESNKNLCSDKS